MQLRGALLLPELAADPATPAAGWGELYVRNDGKVYLKNDAGTVTDLGAGGTSENPIVQIEVNLGSTPKRSGKFDIADASFLAGHQLYIQQAGGPYTGKGSLADEAQMDHIFCRGTITGAGAATVFWSSDTLVRGNFKINYRSS